MLMVLCSPLILVLFLGDILAAPFTARRHESTARWVMFMVVRMLGPLVVLAVICVFLFTRRG